MKQNMNNRGYVLVVFYTILIVCMLFIGGCSQTKEQEITSAISNTINSEEVKVIKEMRTRTGIKLGDLIEAGLSSPTYEIYDPAEDGNTYVTVKGNINYRGQDVVVTIQYKKVSEDNYEFYTIAYNDIAQNQFEIERLFEYLDQEYQKKDNTNQNERETIDLSDENLVEQTNLVETEMNEDIELTNDSKVVQFDEILASSTLKSNTISYEPSLVNDGDYTTSWVEGVDGSGVNEWILLKNNSPIKVDQIEIINGYWKTEKLYYANNRVKKVKIELSDGTSMERELSDEFNQSNYIDLGKTVETTYIKITILDIFRGDKYEDTCISDINVSSTSLSNNENEEKDISKKNTNRMIRTENEQISMIWNNSMSKNYIEKEIQLDNFGKDEYIKIGRDTPCGTIINLYDSEDKVVYRLLDRIHYPEAFDDYGELKERYEIEIVFQDLNNDRNKEMLIAIGDNLIDLGVSIVSICQTESGMSVNEIGYIEGQECIHIDKYGKIIVPIGSQGLFDEYQMKGLLLEQTY